MDVRMCRIGLLTGWLAGDRRAEGARSRLVAHGAPETAFARSTTSMATVHAQATTQQDWPVTTALAAGRARYTIAQVITVVPRARVAYSEFGGTQGLQGLNETHNEAECSTSE